jgi:hypothetical protein
MGTKPTGRPTSPRLALAGGTPPGGRRGGGGWGGGGGGPLAQALRLLQLSRLELVEEIRLSLETPQVTTVDDETKG